MVDVTTAGHPARAVERSDIVTNLSQAWPLAAIATGGLLTLAWIAFLFWGVGRMVSALLGG